LHQPIGKASLCGGGEEHSSRPKDLGLQAAIKAVKNGDVPLPLDDAFSVLRQKYDLQTDA
jgi:hypothetical protein